MFTVDTLLGSYVVLVSTLHRNGRICDQEHQKYEIEIELQCHKQRGGQFKQAGDWLQLQKKKPALATCDNL